MLKTNRWPGPNGGPQTLIKMSFDKQAAGLKPHLYFGVSHKFTWPKMTDYFDLWFQILPLEMCILHSSTGEGDVCALPENRTFEATMEKRVLVSHIYQSQLLSDLQILWLPINQLPDKHGRPSGCEHTVTL